VSLMARDAVSAERRLSRCRRLKPLGIILTVVGLFWTQHVNLYYWVAATRHFPIGAGPPIIEAAVLVLCALFPWWWIGKDSVAMGPEAPHCNSPAEGSG
jgi:hypothetical protein